MMKVKFSGLFHFRKKVQIFNFEKNVVFVLCEWVFVATNVCVPVHSVPIEARRGHWITWNWSYQQLGATMWCWELNVAALEEKPVLLTIRSSLHLLGKGCFVISQAQDRLLGCLRRNSCLVSSQGTKYLCIFSMESVTGSCQNQMLST